MIKNNRGLVTIDFIFAAAMFMIFVSIIFSFSITFSVVEVVQYITFSSARNYSLAHATLQDQEDRAQQKFEELILNPVVASMVNSGWYSIGQVQFADFNDEVASGDDRNNDSLLFVGGRVPFNANILFKRVPILGATGQGEDSFFAFIQSFLAREPTSEECVGFTGERVNGIANLGYTADPGAYAIQTDNGC